MSLSFSTAMAALNMVAELAHKGFLVGLGVSQADYEKLTGKAPWTGSDRHRMSTVLHSLANGSVDAQGLPRFMLPAEYIAATIIVFVAPINIHAACIYAPVSASAEAIGAGGEVSQAPRVSPDQLFSLCVQLYAEGGHSAARAQFERALGLVGRPKLDPVLTAGSR